MRFFVKYKEIWCICLEMKSNWKVIFIYECCEVNNSKSLIKTNPAWYSYIYIYVLKHCWRYRDIYICDFMKIICLIDSLPTLSPDLWLLQWHKKKRAVWSYVVLCCKLGWEILFLFIFITNILYIQKIYVSMVGENWGRLKYVSI